MNKKYYSSKGSTDTGKKKYLEDNLQAEAVKWYNNTFCLKTQNPRGLIYAVPNGGSRNAVEALKLRDTGTLAGVSDLHIILPNGRFLFAEAKIIGGRQSDSQKDFEQRVKFLGFEYIIFYDLEEFKNMIYARL